MKTYFITGGAGFIGSNFIHYLFNKYKDSIKVVNIDSLTYAGNLKNLDNIPTQYIENGNYVFEQFDICDLASIEKLFVKYKPDYVINFAAESHVDRSINNASIFLRTNIMGTEVLLHCSKKYGIERYHQVSTDEVYGSLGETGKFTENTALAPRSPYSASKASADLICEAYFETYNLPLTVSRCSNNYGPYQFPEKLIPLTINNILTNKPMTIYGKGLNVRDWIHVDDHCSGIDLIVHNANVGETFNIGGNNEWRNIDLVKLIVNKVNELSAIYPYDVKNFEELIVHVADRKGHDFRYAIDNSKIMEHLNWEPQVNFHKGVTETIKWYLENKEWMHYSQNRGLNIDGK